MKCPVIDCVDTFTITHKAYPTYYLRKRESTKPQKLASPKWHLNAVKIHLLALHTNSTVADDQNVPTHNDTDSDIMILISVLLLIKFQTIILKVNA